MKIRRHLAILTMILLPIVSFSQTVFQKYIQGSDNWSYGYTDNNEVLLIGDDGFFVNFTKLDDAANILWSKKYTTFEAIVHAIPIPYTNKKLFHFSADTAKIYLSASDDFLYLWNKSYRYDTNIFVPSNSGLSFGKRFSDGNIAMVGSTDIPTGGGFSYDCAPMIALVDSVGNLLWSKQYHITNYSFIPQHIVKNSSGYLLVGKYFTFNGGLQSSPSIATLLVDKQTGASIGQVHEAIFDGEMGINNVSDDGGYIIGSVLDVFGGGNTFGMVAKINADGSFQSIKTITSAAFTNPAMLLKTITRINASAIAIGGSLSGHYFAIKADTSFATFHWGMMYSDTSASGDILNSGEAVLSKTTSDNNLLFWGTFTYGSGMGYAIKVNGVDGMSACNNIPVTLSLHNLTFNFNAYSANTLSNVLSPPQTITIQNSVPEASSGSVSTMCSATIGINELANEQNISIFPNPAHQKITVTIPRNSFSGDTEFVLFNSYGQKVNRSIINSEMTTIELGTMVSGIYFYQIQNANDILKKGKLIIE